MSFRLVAPPQTKNSPTTSQTSTCESRPGPRAWIFAFDICSSDSTKLDSERDVSLEAKDRGVRNVRLSVRPDDILKVGLEIEAAYDVDVVVGLQDHLVRLDAGGVVREREIRRLFRRLHVRQPSADGDIGREQADPVVGPGCPE